MKKTYKGCEIYAEKEESCGGWQEIYWGAFAPDGYEIECEFGGVGSVKEGLEAAMRKVDEYLMEEDLV